uniref:NADH-ubiquinone oxidoreductase chain 2 n=1 Tax=Nipponacmea fuscoviridis TaxID=225302 RepID=A0A6B9QAP4_9GAST|nr:NADH dehydrogenase subunit 2 [Nipponacmea fuscoviridis]QHE50291.1 NADH dehydrogenase subunit 2 [Nipponacmea fuscoviridis]QVH34244.1 NADH dehydrogenase subunit 2 [Nipponacmea fuscoviridis]
MLPSNILFLVLTFVSGTLTISSASWIFVYAGLILNTVAITPNLMKISSWGWKSGDAAGKYFLIQASASAIYAFGSALYWYWDFPALTCMYLHSSEWGLAFLATSLMLKLGMFPFFAWVPGVVQGLSWFNCWLVLTWQKYFPLVILLQVTTSTGGESVHASFPYIVATTSLLGSFLGLAQTQLRSLIAYSSLVHSGWSLMAVTLGIPAITTYLLIYATTLGASLFFLNLISARSIHSPRMRGHKSVNAMVICVLSLAGMPPLLGFLGKWIIIMQWGSLNLPPLSLVAALLGSLISLNFYLSVCWGLFWAKYSEIPLNSQKAYNSGVWAVALNLLPFVLGMVLTNLY